ITKEWDMGRFMVKIVQLFISDWRQRNVKEHHILVEGRDKREHLIDLHQTDTYELEFDVNIPKYFVHKLHLAPYYDWTEERERSPHLEKMDCYDCRRDLDEWVTCGCDAIIHKRCQGNHERGCLNNKLVGYQATKEKQYAMKVVVGGKEENTGEMNALAIRQDGVRVMQIFEIHKKEETYTVIVMERLVTLKECPLIHPKRLIYYAFKSLQECHIQHIQHNDIKPDNILVNEEKQIVFLTDYGISEYIKEGGSASQLTGSIGYLAPEKLLTRPIPFKSDIWSLGATFLHHFCPSVDTDIRGDNHAEYVRAYDQQTECSLKTEEFIQLESEAIAQIKAKNMQVIRFAKSLEYDLLTQDTIVSTYIASLGGSSGTLTALSSSTSLSHKALPTIGSYVSQNVRPSSRPNSRTPPDISRLFDYIIRVATTSIARTAKTNQAKDNPVSH
ncbi:CAMK family protein kinase, partial [Planoprotostelium fungivorum]